MGLGFTVEELVAAGRGSGALRMGLARLGESEWLWSEFDRAARAEVFARCPESVMINSGGEGAAREAARLVAGCEDLGEAAAAVWEDLCVLEADATGQYRLTSAAVGFPTDWRLEAKIGQPLTAIHAPIHGYAEELAAGVDHFFRALQSGAIFGRANWFVVASDAWRYLPEDEAIARFAHVTPANAGEALFVRCERQTLRRLPLSGAVLFTIGIALAPLGALSATLIARIAENVAGLSGGEHERRAAPHYAAALAGYAAHRAKELEKAA